MHGQPKILIVEDEILVSLHISSWLERRGYGICTLATTGDQAVQTARTETPDLVLLDVRLAGDVDGLEVAHQIRSFSQAPFVFISGYLDDLVRAQALTYQPAVYLDKPLNWNQLGQVLQTYLNRPETGAAC